MNKTMIGINSKVARKFRLFIVKKHGQIWGHFGPELEKAIVEYIERHKGGSGE